MSSSPQDYFNTASETARQAVAADEAGQWEEAARLYVRAVEWFQMYIRYSKNPRAKDRLKEKLLAYVERAEVLRKAPAPRKQPQAATAHRTVAGGDKGLRAELEGAVVMRETPDVSWDDVAGLEDAKTLLQTTVILPMRQPQMFGDRRKPWTGVLLYGPPGTGKSYLAKALATEAKCAFFSVSSANLISKWVGESGRLVKELFEMARENAPCIVFIDEVETLCGARDGGSGNRSESLDQIVTEFLKQMDGVGTALEGVLVLGATNLPWTLDSAIRRRFQKRVYIPLPNRDARLRIIRNHAGADALSPEDCRKLAMATEGYSAADVATLINDAMMGPVNRVHSAQFYAPHGGDGEMVPCSQRTPGAVQMTWKEIPDGKIRAPPVTVRDFVVALKRTPASVLTSDLEKYDTWQNTV